MIYLERGSVVRFENGHASMHASSMLTESR